MYFLRKINLPLGELWPACLKSVFFSDLSAFSWKYLDGLMNSVLLAALPDLESSYFVSMYLCRLSTSKSTKSWDAEPNSIKEIV